VGTLYTMLIVDDDPLVREVVAAVLAEPGYHVVTASDGYEAIRILADRHFDLMITDIKMPGLDGVQLGIQAKLMRPRLHIIYITACADAAQKAEYGMVLEKPIRAAELVKTVRQEMAAS
jgi:CheY-like chemotaxis protein